MVVSVMAVKEKAVEVVRLVLVVLIVVAGAATVAVRVALGAEQVVDTVVVLTVELIVLVCELRSDEQARESVFGTFSKAGGNVLAGFTDRRARRSV